MKTNRFVLSRIKKIFYAIFSCVVTCTPLLASRYILEPDEKPAYSYVFRPTFELLRLLKLLLLPILAVLLPIILISALAFVVNIVFSRRREIRSMIGENIEKISTMKLSSLLKLSTAIVITISYLALHPFLNEMIGIESGFIGLLCVALMIVANPTLWIFLFLFWFSWNLFSILKSMNDSWKNNIEERL